MDSSKIMRTNKKDKKQSSFSLLATLRSAGRGCYLRMRKGVSVFLRNRSWILEVFGELFFFGRTGVPLTQLSFVGASTMSAA